MRTAALLAVILTACRSQQQIPVRELAAISPTSAGVSAKMVSDPNAPELQLGPGEEFVRPQLNSDNRVPVYPQQLVALRLPPHTIGVRVTFDESGRAVDVGPSPLVPSTADSYRSAFEAAVDEAVKRWRCYPPRIRKFRPGPDTDGDGKPDYRIMTAQRVFKTFFDLAFDFEIINGQPVVKRGS
jgi:hypothetical protein